jgi:hypothetical protein
MPLKLLSWNIEQFGKKRSGDTDRLRQIRRVLNEANADLICIQEVKAETFHDVNAILGAVRSHVTGYEFILAPHNNLETYAWLYKPGALQPLTLRSSGPKEVDEHSLATTNFVPHAGSTTSGMGPSGLDHYFPLFRYQTMRAGRAPGLGLFRYTHGTTQRFLAVLNWHNDTARSFAFQNIKLFLHRTDCIRDGQLDIRLNNARVTVENLVIAADLNYALEQYQLPDNWELHVNEKTHLHRFTTENDSKFHTSNDVRDLRLDNILTILATLHVGSPTVGDLPRRLMLEATTQTKAALAESELIAQARQAARHRDRLFARAKKKINTKTHNPVIGAMLANTNLGRVGKQTLMRKIAALNIGDKHKATLAAVASDFLDKELAGHLRWIRRLDNMGGLLYNDTLSLTHTWMSDHLPLCVRIAP